MDCVMRSGARLILSITQLPDSIAAHDYNLEEPPEASASWVEDLTAAAGILKECLEQVLGLEPAMKSQASGLHSPGGFLSHWRATELYHDAFGFARVRFVLLKRSLPVLQNRTRQSLCVRGGMLASTVTNTRKGLLSGFRVIWVQLWRHALRHIGEVALEGLSRVKGCSAVGRTAMASDLQDLGYSLKSLLQPIPPDVAAALAANLRQVDGYIKVRISGLYFASVQTPSFQA